ncbi:hypothetical protein MLD38_014606 [Melastoma candidum]|uniref:Uncharacterized protein n=1 Tax=Melastoma candidum TaxID=119954 RepID=A0ACB9RDE7_9MYRT|nr:hypothetical protein MLD38_014606 [Melastoma candidum]
MDFFVDPFDDICRFCFTRLTAFCFKDTGQYAVIRCDFKMEFLSREVLEVKQYKEISYLDDMIWLSSSPLLYYRTTDYDREQNVPFDLLDDEIHGFGSLILLPVGLSVIATCSESKGIVLFGFSPETGVITVAKIIEWMGKFHNKNLQSVLPEPASASHPHATVEVPLKHANQDLPDVKHNNCLF